MKTHRRIWTEGGELHWSLANGDGDILADGTAKTQADCEAWLDKSESIARSGALDDSPGDDEEDENDEGLDDDDFEALAEDLGLEDDGDDEGL